MSPGGKEVREQYRKKKFEEEQKANQRRLVQKEKEAEIQSAAEKKKQDLERLQRLREQNILRKDRASEPSRRLRGSRRRVPQTWYPWRSRKWELQEDVIDEVQQRFGFTPPKLQWEQGSEVQLAALRAWNRDVTEQRWEELHRCKSSACHSLVSDSLYTTSAAAGLVVCSGFAYSEDRSPRRGDWYSSEEKDIYDLPTVSLSVKNSDTDPGGHSPRRGRRVEQSGAFGNPQNSSPDDQSIPAWQIEESSAYPTVRIDVDTAEGSPPALHGHLQAEPAHVYRNELPTDVWLRPEAYGERSSSSTPNYGNAEVYHLEDYSDGDTVHNTTYSAGLTFGPCYESHSKVRTAASGAGDSCSIFGKQSRTCFEQSKIFFAPTLSGTASQKGCHQKGREQPLALQTHLGDNRQSESHRSLLHQGEKATGSQIPYLGQPLRTGRRSTSSWTGTGCST
ncbi:unnamed protein product [Effrenium voratum]|uniref:Uncharacterized protein n=1 Tax=Effrenium voratum TaxID=2562239 RepID=A0AA36HW66_9DINO|nr:unnamed protein product [Effrenium voratum]